MDDFERELAQRFKALELPPSAEEARQAAVQRGMAERVRGQRRRRRGIAVAIAVALVAGAAAAAIALTRDESGRTVPEGPPGAKESRAGSPYLQGLPWLWQPNGNRVVTDTPAGTKGLVFPASVSYRDAVAALYRSVSQSGTLPRGARVVDAPVRGVVLQHQKDGRFVVNLAAPFGYDPSTGMTRTPRLQFPRSVTLEEAIELQKEIAKGPVGAPWPKGAVLAWPTPPACQVLPRPRSVRECAFIRNASD